MSNDDMALGQSDQAAEAEATQEEVVPTQAESGGEEEAAESATEEVTAETEMEPEATDDADTIASTDDDADDTTTDDEGYSDDDEGQDDTDDATSVVETTPSDNDLFLAALNGDFAAEEEFGLTTLHRGQITTGTIASITPNEILVDVGGKSEGIIAGRELEQLGSDTISELNVGDDIDVYVLTPEDRDGHILLSLRRALEEQDWHQAETYLKDKENFKSTVTGYNKGGLIVRFGKVRGFVPSSQVSRDRRMRSTGGSPDERWGKMVGEEIMVKVIEVDRGRNRLILSERAAEREKRAAMRDELFDGLEKGQVFQGRVTRLADFGAFVDIGGMDGLVHISELAWRPIDHPRDVVKAGDEIEVEVISVDPERQRVGLSRKNRLSNPWDDLASEYSEDQLVQGTVTKLTKFGAFARLTDMPEIEGLIHISELADRRVGHPREVVEEGQVVTLRIIKIDTEKRRMGLSLKRVDSAEYMAMDWQPVMEEMNAEDDNGEDDDAVVAEAEADVVAEVAEAEVEEEAAEVEETEIEADDETEAEEAAEEEATNVEEVEMEAEDDTEAEEDDEEDGDED